MEHSEPDWGRGHAPNMEEQDRQIRGKRKGVWGIHADCPKAPGLGVSCRTPYHSLLVRTLSPGLT